jgi:KipI family sensor histidine kinase inhibitor
MWDQGNLAPEQIAALPRFQPAGDSALLVTFGEQIDLAANRQAHALGLAILEAQSRHLLPGLGEAVPGYVTLLVHYDPLRLNYKTVEHFVRQNLANAEGQAVEPRQVEVPVVYGDEAGPDLAFVAEHCGLAESEVIRIHSERDYPVYMMGFTPGFPYLGGMDPAIAAPRLSSPRSRVAGGSVGIAGEQTGIYPLDSPGGWRIIGRTPLRLFDPTRESPFLLAPGDLVRFVPVS